MKSKNILVSFVLLLAFLVAACGAPADDGMMEEDSAMTEEAMHDAAMTEEAMMTEK
ncbi:MAG: hypothetical protein IPJ47_08460 [Anaerolineales bacterium]|nr:hypothetical protein [Anaerolineales bacterium]